MKRQIVGLLLVSTALLRADVEVISEQGSKPSKNVGIIEVRNDTKDDLGLGVVIQNKGKALFRGGKALTTDRAQGRLKTKDYVRITEVVGGPSAHDERTKTVVPFDVTGWFKIQIWDPKINKSVTYMVDSNNKRKVIALVVEKDKNGNISVRAQKGSKAKALFTGGGSGSGIHLNGNVVDEDIKKQ